MGERPNIRVGFARTISITAHAPRSSNVYSLNGNHTYESLDGHTPMEAQIDIIFEKDRVDILPDPPPDLPDKKDNGEAKEKEHKFIDL